MRPPVKHLWVCGCLLLGSLAAFHAAEKEPQTGAARTSEEFLDAEIARGLVDDISQRVADLRGLDFVRPVTVRIIDDDAARRHIIERVESFQSLNEIDTLSTAYQLLGLLPAGSDVLEIYLDALREQAGGFYDPGKDTYFLLDDMPAALAPVLTAHELTHALEDQHFDLDGRLRRALPNDDRVFALSSVHEGSATLLMGAYVVAAVQDGSMTMEQLQAASEMEQSLTAGLAAMPEVLLRQLIGPYILGGGFLLDGTIAQLAISGYPEEKIDRAYGDPGPQSSEQILHPEKFWDAERYDPPVVLPPSGADRWLGSAWSLAGQGVLGEITLAVMVGDGTGRVVLDPASPNDTWTVPAAAGWGGDRWEVWRSGERSLVVFQTSWDSEPDAEEFAAALEESETLRSRRDGRRVVIVAGDFPEKKARKLLKKLASRSGAG